MRLRQVHRWVGMTFAPFFLLTATAGMLLLWRRTHLYADDTKGLLLGLHNWEIVADYVGVLLAGALCFMTVSGCMIAIGMKRRRGRAK